MRGMDTPVTITHERVDDIPVIVQLAAQLGLPEVLDEVLGRHGLHQGLSNGWLATVWIGYILSEADHRKVAVQEWVNSRRRLLSRLIGQPLRAVDFTDDRLGLLLGRLSRPVAWQAIEERLWRQTVLIYELPLSAVRLDSTTSYGYHTTTDDGLMQLGHSKDHRPDLPQLKLMAAAAEPSGQLIGSDVHAGQSADDPLYVPLIERVRQLVGRTGLLYIGDSKMAALDTRARIAAAGDYYLMPAPGTGTLAKLKPQWIEDCLAAERTAVDGAVEPVHEVQRELTAEVDGTPVTFSERVVLVRSPSLAERRTTALRARLSKAEGELLALTPPPGRGRRQHREAGKFLTAIQAVLQRHRVSGLLKLTCRVEVDAGGGERFVVEAVERNEAAIAHDEARLGWRVLLTNLPAEAHEAADVVALYNAGWLIETDFHLLKDRPLGIQPLYVQRDEQIIGLTHLLTLALRILTLIQTLARRSLKARGEKLAGLYTGQPARTTDRPTGQSLLKAFARAELTLTHIHGPGRDEWHLTPLSNRLKDILGHLGLSTSVYESLALIPHSRWEFTRTEGC